MIRQSRERCALKKTHRTYHMGPISIFEREKEWYNKNYKEPKRESSLIEKKLNGVQSKWSFYINKIKTEIA